MEWQNIAPLLAVVHASQGVPEANQLRAAALAELVELNKIAGEKNLKIKREREAKELETKHKAEVSSKDEREMKEPETVERAFPSDEGRRL